jgi:type IV secretion system protein VirB6
MGGLCPAYGPEDPLVSGLLASVDCNVQALIASGYGALFSPSGAFAAVLTAALTLYVAFIGYRLMLGRSPLNVGEVVLTAVKLGAVLAFATQWGAYQRIVYHVLFHGPQQIADLVLRDFGDHAGPYGGDVFQGLQRAFVDLTSFSPATPPGAPPPAPLATGPIGGVGGPLSPNGAAGGGALSALLNKAGFDSLLLLFSALVLVLSSLGVLLAAKIVLGMLLATGPIFIAMLLFDSTRGLFEGWLRASAAFAFAPLAVTLMLGVALTMLEPSLVEVEAMRDSSTYIPGVAFAVTVLVMVFAGVAIAMVVAAGALAAGFRLPRRSPAAVTARATATSRAAQGGAAAAPSRAARAAGAMAARERREPPPPAASPLAARGAETERRTTISTTVERGARDVAIAARLGQTVQRGASPRTARRGARREP